MKPCPVCKCEPICTVYNGFGRNSYAVVRCECGMHGPTINGVPNIAEFRDVDEFTALHQEAEYQWDKLPAHGIAKGEEPAWVAVVTALRDALHAARVQAQYRTKQLHDAMAHSADLSHRLDSASADHEELAALREEVAQYRAVRTAVPGADRFELMELDP